jgi:hypothetical protein
MQPGSISSTASFCEGRLAPNSIHAVLHRERRSLFPDKMFADLFAEEGRRSVPPMIVAVVMVLQRLEGLSDREAVDRFAFDVRWKYAAGGLDFDHPGFVHTVLVDFRARLAASDRPDRIFATTVEVAGKAGLIGRKRVLDSTPIYDAVATQDTITLIRSAIRALLRAAERPLRIELRELISSGDAYTDMAKPVIDWTDAAEREALIDSRAKDAHAMLAHLDGLQLPAEVVQAAVLLATVVGQDLDQGSDGVFRIARRVAKDRVISTVDPPARHGHKTSARGFDGYKGHLAADPDSEIVTATRVTAGNQGDADAAVGLLTDVLSDLGGPDPPRPAARRSRIPDRNRIPRPAPRPAAMPPTARATCWKNCKLRAARRNSRPAAGQQRRPVHQGRLRHRPGRSDGDLPERSGARRIGSPIDGPTVESPGAVTPGLPGGLRDSGPRDHVVASMTRHPGGPTGTSGPGVRPPGRAAGP